ncbi:hypothetical protein RHSIM_Rhsim07G0167200 [Rhododendron simsii]|uniref:Protein FAR1-RELATED SEQUENCE n=1 Tax=Rhododendron simsii TaxID=118357 RepID=A0A834GSH1_RHOSS|nr:hypothetical protein RHSIM_Rhsim07G0167200 [Rhododendron simsii]
MLISHWAHNDKGATAEDLVPSYIMNQPNGSQGEHANIHNHKERHSRAKASEEDSYAFYNEYTKEMGFSIQKDRMKVDEANVPLMRKWGVWDVGFILKDLQNKIEAERKVELKDEDAEGALGYLSAKADANLLFFFKYIVDEDNRLGKLLWADSKSQMDNAAFGDVLIFDTTYQTDAYKKLFVILAGLSNHFLTTIFGCALFVDETFATDTWVLETLMEICVCNDRWALGQIQNREAKTEVRTENSFSVLSTQLKRLEKHGANMFTRNIFFLFREELTQASKYIVEKKVVTEEVDHHKYYLFKYGSPEKMWTVDYLLVDNRMIVVSCKGGRSNRGLTISYEVWGVDELIVEDSWKRQVGGD